MKTKTVLALTLVGITTLFVPLTTEARGFWDNIIKIPQKIDFNNIGRLYNQLEQKIK